MTVRNPTPDRPSIDPCAQRRRAARDDELMRIRQGHGLDEAARLHVEAGAERLPRHSLSGRDPP